jgi:hypothetical protein
MTLAQLLTTLSDAGGLHKIPFVKGLAKAFKVLSTLMTPADSLFLWGVER